MKYCINPFAEEPIFLIDSQIGRDDENPSDAFIDGAEFVRELLEVDEMGKKRMCVWVNSPGGLVTDGMAIYGAILKTKTKVDTFCYGIAYSIAGVIFQAGRKRVMMDYSKLMYHEAYSESGRKDKGLEALQEAITTMVSARSWKDEEAVRKMMKQTSYIKAEDARESGLCDEVDYSQENNRPRITSDIKASVKFANDILNKILPTNENNNDTMKKEDICKLLNLDPSVSDAYALNALEKYMNKAKENEEALKVSNKAKEDAEAAKAKAEKDLTDAKAKSDKEELEAAQAKDKAEKKEAAKTKILAVAKERGVKLEDKVVDKYVNLATESESGLETVVDIINETPVVKPSVLADVDYKAKEGEVIFKLNDKGGVTDTSDILNSMNKKVKAIAKSNGYQ